MLVSDCSSKFFPIQEEIFRLLSVAVAELLNISQFLKKMKNWVLLPIFSQFIKGLRNSGEGLSVTVCL